MTRCVLVQIIRRPTNQRGITKDKPGATKPHEWRGVANSAHAWIGIAGIALDTADDGPTPEDNLIRLDNEAALHTALEKLEPPLREALLLCDVEEVKYKDIALILDIPIGTVMSRISRARRALRQLLQPQLGEFQ